MYYNFRSLKKNHKKNFSQKRKSSHKIPSQTIQSDFARLEAETTSGEAQAVQEHQTFMRDTESDIAIKTQNIANRRTSIANKHRRLQEIEVELKNTQKELDAATVYPKSN
jgi:uncharacterized protein (DUF3084 family)